MVKKCKIIILLIDRTHSRHYLYAQSIYLKILMLMKRFYLLMSLLISVSVARGEDYVPMLELGKEWRYTVHDCRSFTDVWNDDYEFKYRVDGTTEIDGKEYFIINEYADCPYEEERMRLYGYMREDLEAKEVYWRRNPEAGYGHIGFWHEGYAVDDREHENENLLYAFGNYDDGHILRPDRTYGHERNLVYSEIEANDGKHRGYMQEGDELFGCFEGIGLVQRPETIKFMSYGQVIDLFGFYPVTTGGGAISPFLYAVVAPDGTEIFSIDKHRPGAGLEKVEASNAEEAPAEYYNLQGMRIFNPAKGTVCIRRQGGLVTKVIIP